MGVMSAGHWIIVLIVKLILFGAGKLPKVMGDLGKGIKNFRNSMNEEKDDEIKALSVEDDSAIKPKSSKIVNKEKK